MAATFRLRVHPRTQKVHLTRVVRTGAIQKWFKEAIGDKSGACVARLTRDRHGHSAATQYAIAAYCAPRKGQVRVPENLRRPVPPLNPATVPGGPGQGF